MSLLSFSSLSFSFRCCINCDCLCCQFLHCNYYLLCSWYPPLEFCKFLHQIKSIKHLPLILLQAMPSPFPQVGLPCMKYIENYFKRQTHLVVSCSLHLSNSTSSLWALVTSSATSSSAFEALVCTIFIILTTFLKKKNLGILCSLLADIRPVHCIVLLNFHRLHLFLNCVHFNSVGVWKWESWPRY